MKRYLIFAKIYAIRLRQYTLSSLNTARVTSDSRCIPNMHYIVYTEQPQMRSNFDSRTFSVVASDRYKFQILLTHKIHIRVRRDM